MKYMRVVGILLLTITLTGCSIPMEWLDSLLGKEEDSTEEALAPHNIDETIDFLQDIPKSVPNVLVNQIGYEVNSKKIVIFRGEDLGESFELIDAETEEVVYTGEIYGQKYNEKSEEMYSYGSFTEFEKAGKYYIQTALIGQSYEFVIDNDIYVNLLSNTVKTFYYHRCGYELTEKFAGLLKHAPCHTQEAATPDGDMINVPGGWHQTDNYDRNLVEMALASSNLLLAYEFYPTVFSDAGNIPESGNQIPDVLDEIKYASDFMLAMQQTKSGGVYEGVYTNENDKSILPVKQNELLVKPVTFESTALFAAFMTKFSQSYKAVDEAYANECLRAAQAAWKYLEKNNDEKHQDAKYYAAAELYKATGNNAYHTFIKKYNEKESRNLEEFTICNIWGDVAYLTTKKTADISICDILMQNIMEEVENIVAAASQNSMYISVEEQENIDETKLLERVMLLAIIDHVISNHEYQSVLDNHLHYLLGRNEAGTCLVTGVGSNSVKASGSCISLEMSANMPGLLDMSLITGNNDTENSVSLYRNSLLLFMLSEICTDAEIIQGSEHN